MSKTENSSCHRNGTCYPPQAMRKQPHNRARPSASPFTRPRPIPSGALRVSAPDVFQDLVGCYAGLLDKAVQRREYNSGPAVSAVLRELGARLGRLGAGARDVIELHAGALDEKTAATAPVAQIYVEEGRLLVLELMGHLLSYYRMECLQAGGDGLAPAGANRGNGHG